MVTFTIYRSYVPARFLTLFYVPYVVAVERSPDVRTVCSHFGLYVYRHSDCWTIHHTRLRCLIHATFLRFSRTFSRVPRICRVLHTYAIPFVAVAVVRCTFLTTVTVARIRWSSHFGFLAVTACAHSHLPRTGFHYRAAPVLRCPYTLHHAPAPSLRTPTAGVYAYYLSRAHHLFITLPARTLVCPARLHAARSDLAIRLRLGSLRRLYTFTLPII